MSESFTTHEETATDTSWPWELLLLHGTGGDERDLIPLGQRIAPGIGMLGVRGQISENGAARYFRRFSEGQLDIEDLKLRAESMTTFLEKRQVATTQQKPFMIVGYSNGANIGTALLQIAPNLFAGAILLRAMRSLELDPVPSLRGKSILLVQGDHDPLVPREQVIRLRDFFSLAGADVQLAVPNVAHSLTHADISTCKEWLSTQRAQIT